MKLIIHHLSKTYADGTQALNEVSLEIAPGMFGLLGPNGAGKSSLMRTLATLQEADRGEAYLESEHERLDILQEKMRVRQLLGYLPQEFGVYPRMSAEEMLDHFAALKGIHQPKQRREIVKALLEQTNLYPVRKRKLGGYSGGMKQRFGIAQALLGNPKILIVDEPTAGLDPAERNRFHNLLSEVGQNIIVILSTHIVEDVSNLCNQMAIIHKGEVRLTGYPAQIIADAQGKVWKKNIDKAELSNHQKRYNVISSRFFAGSGQVIIKVYAELKPDATFEPAEADLEDVYFNVIKEAEKSLLMPE
ncbi:MAG: ABC transporter ATP-binding protein [Microscillaceae bacterium]